MTETYILLNSELATRPNGQKKLDAEWTFAPPLSLSSKGEFCISLQDFHQETAGLLMEVVANIEVSIDGGLLNWTLICKSLYFDPKSATDLPNQLKQLFENIFDHIEQQNVDPPLLKVVGQSKILQLSGKGFNVRFSLALQKLLSFPRNYVDNGEQINAGKVSGIPTVLPVYLTLDDIGNNNCIIPVCHDEVVKHTRFESVLALIKIAIELPFERFLVETQLTPVVVRDREISRLRVALRYLETGNVVHTKGLFDRFSCGLSLTKRLLLLDIV